MQTKIKIKYFEYCAAMAVLINKYNPAFDMFGEIYQEAIYNFENKHPSELKKLTCTLEKKIDDIEKQKPELFFSTETKDYIETIKHKRKELEGYLKDCQSETGA